jgi:RNA-directed DNA polymerase
MRCTTKVYRRDIPTFAYQCCKANGGAAGVDGRTLENIAAYRVERWLDELAKELKSRTYPPFQSGGSTCPSRTEGSDR